MSNENPNQISQKRKMDFSTVCNHVRQFVAVSIYRVISRPSKFIYKGAFNKQGHCKIVYRPTNMCSAGTSHRVQDRPQKRKHKDSEDSHSGSVVLLTNDLVIRMNLLGERPELNHSVEPSVGCERTRRDTLTH